MRIGVVLMPTEPWPDTVAAAHRIETLGYDHLWVYDHLSWQRYRDRPWHATYPWLTGVAAATVRIRLGTLVSNPNIRHPYLLAKDAMTIDHISNGRLTIGLGAGGAGFDATALGQAPLSPRERIDRLDEYTRILDGLLRGDIEDFAGDWFDVAGARLLPGCVQTPRVPLAIAAGGKRALAIAAAFGDAWVTTGDTVNGDRTVEGTLRAVGDQLHGLEEACDAIGRDPAEIARIHLSGHTDISPLASIDAFDEIVGRFGELGFTDFVFHHPRADDERWNDDPAIVEQIAERHLAH